MDDGWMDTSNQLAPAHLLFSYQQMYQVAVVAALDIIQLPL